MAILNMPGTARLDEFDAADLTFTRALTDQLALLRAAVAAFYPGSLLSLWVGRQLVDAARDTAKGGAADSGARAAIGVLVECTMNLDAAGVREMFSRQAVAEALGPFITGRGEGDFSLYGIIHALLTRGGDPARAYFQRFNYAPGEMLDTLAGDVSAVLAKRLDGTIAETVRLLEEAQAYRAYWREIFGQGLQLTTAAQRQAFDAFSASVFAFWDRAHESFPPAEEIVPELIEAVHARLTPICNGIVTAVSAFGEDHPDWLASLCRYFWELETLWAFHMVERNRLAMEGSDPRAFLLNGLLCDGVLEVSEALSAHWRLCVEEVKRSHPDGEEA